MEKNSSDVVFNCNPYSKFPPHCLSASPFGGGCHATGVTGGAVTIHKSHTNDESKKKDVEKERVLQNAGVTILRFTNEEVLNNLTKVRERIMQWIEGKGEVKNQI